MEKLKHKSHSSFGIWNVQLTFFNGKQRHAFTISSVRLVSFCLNIGTHWSMVPRMLFRKKSYFNLQNDRFIGVKADFRFRWLRASSVPSGLISRCFIASSFFRHDFFDTFAFDVFRLWIVLMALSLTRVSVYESVKNEPKKGVKHFNMEKTVAKHRKKIKTTFGLITRCLRPNRKQTSSHFKIRLCKKKNVFGAKKIRSKSCAEHMNVIVNFVVVWDLSKSKHKSALSSVYSNHTVSMKRNKSRFKVHHTEMNVKLRARVQLWNQSD